MTAPRDPNVLPARRTRKPKPVDWSRASYSRVSATAKMADRGFTCEICHVTIVRGDRVIRGPRGERWAHTKCVPQPDVSSPPEGTVQVVGALDPNTCRSLGIPHLTHENGEGYMVLRAAADDLRRMPLYGRVAIIDADPRTRPPLFTLALLAKLLERIDRLTKREFVNFMAPLYRRDVEYAEGLWPQFVQGPIPFLLSRNPREPGEKLLAMLLRSA